MFCPSRFFSSGHLTFLGKVGASRNSTFDCCPLAAGTDLRFEFCSFQVRSDAKRLSTGFSLARRQQMKQLLLRWSCSLHPSCPLSLLLVAHKVQRILDETHAGHVFGTRCIFTTQIYYSNIFKENTSTSIISIELYLWYIIALVWNMLRPADSDPHDTLHTVKGSPQTTSKLQCLWSDMTGLDINEDLISLGVDLCWWNASEYNIQIQINQIHII